MSQLFSTLPDRTRVLLVEDDSLVRLVTAEMLSGAGFAVVDVEDAGKALAVLGRGNVPDILVTDVRMPGPIDGIALAGIVAGRWPQIGILVCSAHACPAEGELPAGAIFLRKPFATAMLVRQVTALAAHSPVAATA